MVGQAGIGQRPVIGQGLIKTQALAEIDTEHFQRLDGGLKEPLGQGVFDINCCVAHGHSPVGSVFRWERPYKPGVSAPSRWALQDRPEPLAGVKKALQMPFATKKRPPAACVANGLLDPCRTTARSRRHPFDSWKGSRH
jgi:hypothetical protein